MRLFTAICGSPMSLIQRIGAFGKRPGAKHFGDLYASFMDEAAIERSGATPLRPYFLKIDAVNDKQKLRTLF
jgi:predicted metalloendopeptidase